ncbi:M23 family metallopeptidase [Oceanicoccus sagamiensis]|uniref:M23ase beta-sheet core domain-containing protein n=1 Tax=Oceanicoccus sagamiensis TaxID=716816 RepID=A0A1X9N894_9GAMM|nr:hypothetical protein BST96_03855 [Oceanicoccus sagamiensis]
MQEGAAILAPANGRVIMLVDDRTLSGIKAKGGSRQDMLDYQRLSKAHSNRLAIDHGDGSYSHYWHHKPYSARVRPGDYVAAGAHIADVGLSGTSVAHICFSLRDPLKPQGWDVRFRDSGLMPIQLRQGETYISSTESLAKGSKAFSDSVLQGHEFKANGVVMDGGQPLFTLPSGRLIEYSGRVLQEAAKVGFYLWPEAKSSEYVVTTKPDRFGRFKLSVLIPRNSRGVRQYTIAITTPDGRLSYPATSIVNIR